MDHTLRWSLSTGQVPSHIGPHIAMALVHWTSVKPHRITHVLSYACLGLLISHWSYHGSQPHIDDAHTYIATSLDVYTRYALFPSTDRCLTMLRQSTTYRLHSSCAHCTSYVIGSTKDRCLTMLGQARTQRYQSICARVMRLVPPRIDASQC